jgi:hypothetical protein
MQLAPQAGIIIIMISTMPLGINQLACPDHVTG